MLNAARRKRAWLTQRMANRYPPWSRVRRFQQSVGQQIIDPIAMEIQDHYWQSTYNLFNRFLPSCDLHQIQNLKKLALPGSFEFDTEDQKDRLVYKTPSSVRGELADGSWVTLALATDNSLREFWYGVPTRITAADDSVTYTAVVPETEVQNLGSISPTAPYVAGRLWVTMAGNSEPAKAYYGRIVRSTVEIVGRDVFGISRREKVTFTYNGTVQTRTEWSEINQVLTEYIDDTATIRIDWLPVGDTTLIDTYSLHITETKDKFRFFRLGSQTYGSTLVFETFSAEDFYSVQQGEDDRDTVMEQELLSAAGANVNASWLSLWPKRPWVVATDGSNAHFFFPEYDVGDRSSLQDRSPEVVFQIDNAPEFAVRNETISLDYNLTRPYFRVLRTRWSVRKPDGSIVGLDETGGEIAFSESGWITNEAALKYRRLGYQGNPISYTVTSAGTYTFYLETMLKDSLASNEEVPVRERDAWTVTVSQNTALSSVALPASVGVASSLTFDAYGRPWAVSTSGTSNRLDFHYDYYLVDFTGKMILAREPYTNISVTP